jgi:dihydrofolate synthase/folylpolyglutamate synthase
MFQRTGASAYKADLTNTIALCDQIHNPQNALTCIHIAGTNGKGSTSHMLASVFQHHGYKTGLYTSPHLVDFKERIRVNGDPVTEEYVVNFVVSNQAFIEKTAPSFFELTVAMAFDYFKLTECEVCIIETGLGGRLDSTNVITPILSVITNIGYDHMDLLGDTLEKIAGEKAGIIKPKIPALIGEKQDEIAHVFINKAQEVKAPLHFAADFKINPDEYESDLRGIYQQKNKTTVLSACQMLQKQFDLKDEIIRTALQTVSQTTGLQGRWQKIQDHPTVICDTGHNKDGIALVMQQLKAQDYQNLHIVWGMVREKDTSGIWPLLIKNARYYFTQPSIPRAKPVDELFAEARAAELEGSTFATVPNAYQAALQEAKENDLIFVGGSTFVVADLLTYLTAQP